MADLLTVTGFGFQFNVESFTVMGESAAIAVSLSDFGIMGGFYALMMAFGNTTAITVADATTGVTYDLKVSSYALTHDALEPGGVTAFLTFGLTSISPPFSGTLTGMLPTPCFAHGTLIASPEGPRKVEEIARGDSLTTTEGPLQVSWVGHRRVTKGSLVRIKAGAIDAGVPSRDLIVTPDHALFLGGALVPVKLLSNGSTIVVESTTNTVVFHVEMKRHAVLYAEGCPAESYLDTGNRAQFGNCPLGYDPIDAAAREPCAEMIVAGPRLDAIRTSLRTRVNV